MAGVRDRALSDVGPWPLGINNAVKEDRLPADEDGNILALRDAQNVDLDKIGWPQLRQGTGRIYEGELTHSLWWQEGMPFMLFADAGELLVMFEDERVDLLGREVGNLPLSYELINDRIYFTNRATCGMVTLDGQVHGWAPHQPAGVPTLASDTGYSLTRGLYQVAVTFTDLLGRESGCGRAAAIDIEDQGGIALTDIPQPSDPSATPIVNIYCTGPNDEVLRLATSIPAGITSGSIGMVANGRSLTTQLLQPMPAGQIVRLFNGRLFVAVGRELIYSEPLRYGLFNPVANRIRFTETVDLMEPVGNEGIYVASGKRTYWLSGNDPAAFGQRIARGAGAVRYSGVRVPGNVLGLTTKEDVPVWLASSGHLCIGTSSGIEVLKDGEAVMHDADRAALLFRQQEGLQQIVAALRGPRAQTLAVSDKPVAHVLYRGDAAP
jgi:hypothetical protein